MFAGEFGGGRIAYRFAPAADEEFGAERKEFLGHALAEAGAAAGHQNAPAAQQSIGEHGSLPFRSREVFVQRVMRFSNHARSNSEITMLDVGCSGQFRRGAAPDHAAALDDVVPVGDAG